MKTDKTPEIIDVEPEIIDVEPEVSEDAQAHQEAAQDRDDEPTRETDPEIEQMVEDFVEVGKMWAHHGVTIGKMAADSSAKTLQVTANALGTIARRFRPSERRTKA